MMLIFFQIINQKCQIVELTEKLNDLSSKGILTIARVSDVDLLLYVRCMLLFGTLIVLFLQSLAIVQKSVQ